MEKRMQIGRKGLSRGCAILSLASVWAVSFYSDTAKATLQQSPANTDDPAQGCDICDAEPSAYYAVTVVGYLCNPISGLDNDGNVCADPSPPPTGLTWLCIEFPNICSAIMTQITLLPG